MAFRTFGLYPATRPMRGSTKAGYLGILGHARQAEAQVPVGDIEGAAYGLNIPWWIHFGRRMSLIGNISGCYSDTEGTEIFGGGLDLGMGIRPAVRDQSSTFGWQVTPFAGLHAIGSYDGATAGLLDQFGIANRLELGLFNDIILVIANQFSYIESTKITIEDVQIDPEVAQQVFKNGLMVDIPLSSVQPLYINGFIVDTRFLEDASIKNYQTVGAGFSIRRKGISFEAYISRDFARDYSSWNAGAGIGLGL